MRRAWVVVAVAFLGFVTVCVSANALFPPGVVFGYALMGGAVLVMYRALERAGVER
jgi:hypothetical protein